MTMERQVGEVREYDYDYEHEHEYENEKCKF
jgi:hypothetical protein